MVGAPLQISSVDSVQENVAIESAAIEPINDLDEHVCLAEETSTENGKQTLDEVTTPLSSTRSENEDGLVGMALTPANEATVEQNDAIQTSTETEKVSAPIETPKDDSQLTVGEKVRQEKAKFEGNWNQNDLFFYFSGHRCRRNFGCRE